MRALKAFFYCWSTGAMGTNVQTDLELELVDLVTSPVFIC